MMNGKQVRIKRPPVVEGIPVDEFIQNNADPLWLHQNEMWEYIDMDKEAFSQTETGASKFYGKER